MAWAGACSGFAVTKTCTGSGLYLSCWTGKKFGRLSKFFLRRKRGPQDSADPDPSLRRSIEEYWN